MSFHETLPSFVKKESSPRLTLQRSGFLGATSYANVTPVPHRKPSPDLEQLSKQSSAHLRILEDIGDRYSKYQHKKKLSKRDLLKMFVRVEETPMRSEAPISKLSIKEVVELPKVVRDEGLMSRRQFFFNGKKDAHELNYFDRCVQNCMIKEQFLHFM